MEPQLKTDLSKFNNDWYKKGGSSVKRISWYIFVFFFVCLDALAPTGLNFTHNDLIVPCLGVIKHCN